MRKPINFSGVKIPQQAKRMEPAETDVQSNVQNYTLTSSSDTTSDFRPFVLTKESESENPRTRYVLKGIAIKNSKEESNCLKISIGYQKKHNKGKEGIEPNFEQLRRFPLTDIPEGHEIEFTLSTSQTAQLYYHLQRMYPVAAEGIIIGTTEKVVISGDDAEFISRLATTLQGNRNLASGVLDKIIEIDPDAFDTASLVLRHHQRQIALQVFEKELAEEQWNEGEWEKFFAANPWIFGLALDYHFLTEVENQAHYGGGAVTGKGTQKGDHLMCTPGAARFTVLVEVKKPQTALLGDEYRNGAYLPSKELAGGTAQLLANCRTWDTEGATAKANKFLEKAGINTVEPSGILIIGNTAELKDDDDKLTSFELYRSNLTNPKILAFDELYARAKYIVTSELDKFERDVPAIVKTDLNV